MRRHRRTKVNSTRKKQHTKIPLNGDPQHYRKKKKESGGAKTRLTHILDEIQPKTKIAEETKLWCCINRKEKNREKNYQNPSVNIVL